MTNNIRGPGIEQLRWHDPNTSFNTETRGVVGNVAMSTLMTTPLRQTPNSSFFQIILACLVFFYIFAILSSSTTNYSTEAVRETHLVPACFQTAERHQRPSPGATMPNTKYQIPNTNTKCRLASKLQNGTGGHPPVQLCQIQNTKYLIQIQSTYYKYQMPACLKTAERHQHQCNHASYQVSNYITNPKSKMLVNCRTPAAPAASVQLC